MYGLGFNNHCNDLSGLVILSGDPERALGQLYFTIVEVNDKQIAHLNERLGQLKETIKYVNRFGYPIKQRIAWTNSSIETIDVGIACVNLIIDVTALCGNETTYAWELKQLKEYIERVEQMKKEFGSILHTLKRAETERKARINKSSVRLIGVIMILLVVLMKVKGVIA